MFISMTAGGIIELNLHGLNREEALSAIERALCGCTSSTYRLRLIHGYHGGVSLRNMIYDEFSYGRNSKIKRIENGTNPGITELVLREY